MAFRALARAMSYPAPGLTFRAWSKPQVKPGGRYRCHPIGVLEADAIDTVTIADISEKDAKASGFEDKAELVEYLKLAPDAIVYRVRLHYVGDVDAKPEAFEAPSDEEVAKIEAKLGNEQFIAKAPEEVVEEQRERLGEAAELIKKMDGALARLSG